jgi:uncharacterized membrane protein
LLPAAIIIVLEIDMIKREKERKKDKLLVGGEELQQQQRAKQLLEVAAAVVVGVATFLLLRGHDTVVLGPHLRGRQTPGG